MSRNNYIKIFSISIASMLLFASYFSFSFADSGSGGNVDLSQMSPKELLEFYKKNPDYGKKRLEIDYQKYIEGEWVVLRGEYMDKKTGTPIKGVLVRIILNGQEYKSVTNESGVFNLEVKKQDFKDEQLYKITVAIDHYQITSTYSGKKIREESIFHFKIFKIYKTNDDFNLELQTVHNNFFKEGTVGFEYQERVKKIPSMLGIQGIPFVVFLISIALFLAFLYFRYKFFNRNPIDFEKNRNKNILPFED